MDLEFLQKKYPEFIYKSFNYELKDGDLAVSFEFKIPPDIEFLPRVVFKNVDVDQVKKIGESALANLIFNIGMAEVPSYWKAVCSPKIVIKAGYLDKSQIKFWQDLFVNGMGQFFYENQLPILKPKFINAAETTGKSSVFSGKLSDKFIVPLGGGKDSLVTYELLNQAHCEVATLVVEPNQALKDIAAFVGAQNIEILRHIDPKLVEMKNQGFLNGHTPFSAVLAFDLAVAALLYDFKYVAISQERSSNEGNVKYLGKIVNHQYSKSYDFEKKFNKYAKKYLASDIEFFSFLRPLYELQIAKIFSSYPQYFPVFLSCNKSFTLAARADGATGWCGQCPKCLFTFVALYPFIGREAVQKIFGKNLFGQKELVPLMLQLLGQESCKPFECVGTYAEARAAFFLSLQKTNAMRPYLLNYFEQNILPEYPDILAQSKSIMLAWDKKNNIPKKFQPALKNAVKGWEW